MSDPMKVSEYRDDLPTPAVGRGAAVRRFTENLLGRDFIVGDIHGMFVHLEALLGRVGFDEECDRLFSVGDLVDRGPQSDRALEWLDRPWFFACRGNHEQFAIDSVDPEQRELWVQYNGGEWWEALDDEARRRFRGAFEALPLAMHVETCSGAVGIVHADVPPFLSWDHFMQLLEARNRDAVLYAMWSRNRITGMSSNSPVTGSVERVYCGHTPTRETVLVDNVHYIDTGAVYVQEGYEDARLTLVEVQPETHVEYFVDTTEDP
jgi:serine/threonine protein phosphatase 1